MDTLILLDVNNNPVYEETNNFTDSDICFCLDVHPEAAAYIILHSSGNYSCAYKFGSSWVSANSISGLNGKY